MPLFEKGAHALVSAKQRLTYPPPPSPSRQGCGMFTENLAIQVHWMEQAKLRNKWVFHQAKEEFCFQVLGKQRWP